MGQYIEPEQISYGFVIQENEELGETLPRPAVYNFFRPSEIDLEKGHRRRSRPQQQI